MSELSDTEITIALSKNAALVLFDLLSRYEDSEDKFNLCLEHNGEWSALLELHASITRNLVEPFTPDYGSRVIRARSELERFTGAPSPKEYDDYEYQEEPLPEGS